MNGQWFRISKVDRKTELPLVISIPFEILDIANWLIGIQILFKMFLLKTILIFSLVNISMSGVVNSDTKSLPENVAKNSMSLMETGNNAGPGIVRSYSIYK